MKRMFDKEEIVDLIQEESPKVEVDSELSETSENPVMNKTIYNALEDMQLYQHQICVSASGNTFACSLTIISKNSTPYDLSTLASYLSSNGLTSGTSYLKCGGYANVRRVYNPANSFLFETPRGIYGNGSNVTFVVSGLNIAYSIVDGNISISTENYNATPNAVTIQDIVTNL